VRSWAEAPDRSWGDAGGPERSPADLSPVEVDESLEHTPAELAGVAREHAWARGR
jgi:hypothetical protein